ncbi:MAG: PD-(D/E)XK nuclease family protein, partial [Gemmatimonadota bacterium]|nr:PD-(D/E)XK nuclease family protein [Gemmatimonadota bacterium]
DVRIGVRPRSYSQLTLYNLCGEQYRLSRVVRIPERPSVWLPGGSAFHSFAEEWSLLDWNGDDIPPIEELWQRHFARHMAETEAANPGIPVADWRCANKGRENWEWWVSAGLKMCEDFVAWRHANPHLVIVELPGGGPAIEFAMNPVLNGVTVRAYPDALYVDTRVGEVICVDYKSGSKLPYGLLQHGTYKVGVEKLLGIPVSYGAYYMTRKGTLTEPVPLDNWTEPVVARLFEDMDRSEAAGVYAPNIGSHCQYMCSYKANCIYVGGVKHPLDDGTDHRD